MSVRATSATGTKGEPHYSKVMQERLELCTLISYYFFMFLEAPSLRFVRVLLIEHGCTGGASHSGRTLIYTPRLYKFLDYFSLPCKVE
jgi:hypothetical protein